MKSFGGHPIMGLAELHNSQKLSDRWAFDTRSTGLGISIQVVFAISPLCAQLARAAGHSGMAGGQAIDLANVGQSLKRADLQRMHELKTGALLQCSVVMGAYCGAADAQALQGLRAYGAALGLAFQVVDDVLDVTADSATLGKTAGKDAYANKPTYVSTMGLEASQRYAQTLLTQAENALRDSGLHQTQALQALARMVVDRAH